MPVAESDLGSASALCVLIMTVGERDGLVFRHVGLAFENGDRAWCLAHLPEHISEAFEAPRSGYVWCEVGLPDIRRRTIAAWMEQRRQNPRQIPYGFNSQGLILDEITGDIISAPLGRGFTCATYVRATLAHLGADPVNLASWPAREEDQRWQDFVADYMLRQKKASADYVKAMRSDIGAARLRPEEIMGCASTPFERWPCTFDTAEEVGRTIKAALDSLIKSAAPADNDSSKRDQPQSSG